MLGVEMEANNVNNQYNDRNIGFKVYYDGMVTFYVHLNLDCHTFIFK